MNSYYDDEPYAPQGRSRVAGDGYGPGDGHEPPYQSGGYDRGSGLDTPAYDSGGFSPSPYAQSSGFDPASSGSYGSARPSGSAQVRPHSPEPDFDPFAGDLGDNPATVSGRATVGRAAVRPAGGYDDAAAGGYGLDDGFDPFAEELPGNRPLPTATGRATVGRSSVLAPEAPPGAPGGPGGPDGPDGPDGFEGPDGIPVAKPKTINKKARRRRRILAALAILIMLTGIGVIAVVYYSSTILLPTDLDVPQSTTLYYSDGKTVMAQIGDTNRKIVPADQIKPNVREAVIATEDTSFYSNVGVDFKGIFRAFVNNITGGRTEGASTITQQYARSIANLDRSASYSRKLKEIVLAIKLTQRMKKDDILTNYLNVVYFGRGAYGIEAAAEAYFNKHAVDLETNEAMVLAGLIKDPSDDIYDPACGKGRTPCQSAIDRFNYIKGQFSHVPSHPGFLTPDQVAALQYPTTWKEPKSNAAILALSTPVGYIVHHVMDELSSATDAKGALIFPKTGQNSLLNGGYKIVTSIDKNLEQVAISAAGAIGPDGKPDPSSPMYKIMKGVGAAAVATQPGTGRVLAYYGGANGSNLDFGGIYTDPVTGDGHTTNVSVTPGSSFKTITMAAALKQNLSINSYWYGPNSRKFDGRVTEVHNSGTEACPGVAHVCTMWMALKESLNTVYYAIATDSAAGMSPGKVIDMAYNLGIKQIWSDSRCGGKPQKLTGSNGSQLAKTCIGGEVAFGQFKVTVQDMANAMATLANHGVRANQHFVDKVTQGIGNNESTVYDGNSRIKLTPSGLTPSQVDDETWSMQQVYKNRDEQDNQLANGRQAAVKTGTWQLGDDPKTSHFNEAAFFNGFTANNPDSPNKPGQGQIATSVWVGYTGNPVAVKDQHGKNLSGAGLPAAIWQRIVDAYANAGPNGKPWPLYRFAPAAGTGDPNGGETPSPEPSAPPTPSGPPTDPCAFPNICPTKPTPSPSPTNTGTPTGTPTGSPTGTPSTSKGTGGGGGGPGPGGGH